MLHFDKSNIKVNEKTETVGSTWLPKRTKSFLKIIPIRISGPAGEIDTHALLDDGSTVTLIDSETAYKIGAKGPVDPLNIEAITDTKLAATNSRRVTVNLQGSKRIHKIEARTIEKLRLSPQVITEEDLINCRHLDSIRNEVTYNNSTPKILIGQDNWHLLIASEVKRGHRNQPVASLTELGWVLHGSNNRSLGQNIEFTHHTNATIGNNMEETSLILLKTKVTTLKLNSIPRLELQATVMGSRMVTTVIKEHQIKSEAKILTDSKSVLTWNKTRFRSYKPIIAHHIAAIEENSTVNEWRWIPTKQNITATLKTHSVIMAL